MSRFQFDLATPADDAELRRVLAATPMEGRIALAFLREPSWFAAAVVDGQMRQVVACRDVESGQIVGFGCRSIRTLFVDGQPQRVGYLSSLRLMAEYRNRGLIARGYAYFRRLHDDRQAPYYLTTIAAGNIPALRMLTSARAGLPRYVPAGLFHTFAVPLVKRTAPVVPDGLVVRCASEDDLPTLLRFLIAEGSKRQFFPLVEPGDLFTSDGPWRGLLGEDVWMAWRDGELVGVLGAWDQYAFKQSVVAGYHGELAWLRPALNAWWWLRGSPRLPSPGESLRFRVAALPLVRNDSVEVFDALLSHLVYRYAGGACTHLLVGLHERDPLLAVVRPRSVATYTTHLYLVSWNDAAKAVAASGCTPYLELGTL